MRKWFIPSMMQVVSLFLCLLLLTSCTNPPYRGSDVVGAEEFVLDSYKIQQGKLSILELEGKTVERLSEELLKPIPDSIQNGDVLGIYLYHPLRSDLVASMDAMNEKVGFRVYKGKVKLPEIGFVEVKGLTLQEAQAKIQEIYDQTINDTEVFIQYKDRMKQRVELIGEVGTHSMPVGGKTRLFEVLSKAAVPNGANLFKSYVSRNDEPLPVDLYRLIHQGDMSQNIVMRGGDKIYIASAGASHVMMLGEVNREGILPAPAGFLPLREAIAQAGGIAAGGDRSYIQVIRGSVVQPKIYTLHWKHIVRLPTNSLLLMPGDIVYVASKPIAEWNRFINQILPSITIYEILKRNVQGILIP